MKVQQAEVGSETDQLLVKGLTAARRWLPMWYLYDATGSALYERITQLPEYYLTRTEASILEANASAILDAAGPVRHVVELGSGSSIKTQILLREASRRGGVTFHPIDISASAMEMAKRGLGRVLADVEVQPHVGDYREVLPSLQDLDGGRRLLLFLGSSIGNYDADRAKPLLDLARGFLRSGDRFLLGVDHVKDKATLEAAYDDRQGVTAAFNLNLLARLNREKGADFDLDQWSHHAFYNEAQERIEMHLVSRVDQRVRVPALGLDLRFAQGESIHTENSQKYTRVRLAALASASGLVIERRWNDGMAWFSLNLLRGA